MADRATLLALAERCERATGPDRELDGDIFVALNPELGRKPWRRDVHDRGLFHDDSDLNGEHREQFRFTSSIDAAMTLVAMDVSFCRDGGLYYASNSGGGRVESSYAATPPLALCAAALRVLAETAT